MSAIYNVILNGELQFNNNVEELTAKIKKDNLLKDGNREVSIIRYENNVKYVYTYRNINFYKNMKTEED